LIDQFRYGLRDDVQDLLLTLVDPPSFSEAITQAIRCDNRLFKLRQEKKVTSNAQLWNSRPTTLPLVPQTTPLDVLPSPGVNPFEESWDSESAPDFQHYKGVEGYARSLGIRLGRGTSTSSLILHPKQTTKWLVYIREHLWVLGQATGTLDHKTHHGPDLRGATTILPIVFSVPLRRTCTRMALFPGTPKLQSRNCPEIVPVGVPGLW
jgi:hypothetical protein